MSRNWTETFSQGNLDMSVEYFTDAIKHNPQEFKLFGNRSFCYEKMQQYDKALTDAEIALSLNPTWTKGLYRKGKALVGLKVNIILYFFFPLHRCEKFIPALMQLFFVGFFF